MGVIPVAGTARDRKGPALHAQSRAGAGARRFRATRRMQGRRAGAGARNRSAGHAGAREIDSG
ncbi:hypothetical protein OH687_24910 [Burkholderia anthina]|nr:hypothetical protein OH687_24910 [Burkholderia anthina]